MLAKYYTLVSVVCLVLACLLIYFCYLCIKRFTRRQLKLPRNEYLRFEEELLLPKTVELKQRSKSSLKDTALLRCHYFLRSNGKYSLIRALPGTENDTKQCFQLCGASLPASSPRLYDSAHTPTHTSYLLTIDEASQEMVLPYSNSTRLTLHELLQKIAKHPFVLSVEDIDFLHEQQCIAIVQQFSYFGTLRNSIRETLRNGVAGHSVLTKAQVKVFGKQILSALMFLESKNFPSMKGHLHCNNIIMQERNVCLLSGYENVLLGKRGQLAGKTQRLFNRGYKAIDTICFGYILYEMITGHEPEELIPSLEKLKEKIMDRELLAILGFCLPEHSRHAPSLVQVNDHQFFKGVALRELKKFKASKVHLSSDMKILLKSVRKDRLYKRHKNPRDSLKTSNDKQSEAVGARSLVLSSTDVAAAAPGWCLQTSPSEECAGVGENVKLQFIEEVDAQVHAPVMATTSTATGKLNNTSRTMRSEQKKPRLATDGNSTIQTAGVVQAAENRMTPVLNEQQRTLLQEIRTHTLNTQKPV